MRYANSLTLMLTDNGVDMKLSDVAIILSTYKDGLNLIHLMCCSENLNVEFKDIVYLISDAKLKIVLTIDSDITNDNLKTIIETIFNGNFNTNNLKIVVNVTTAINGNVSFLFKMFSNIELCIQVSNDETVPMVITQVVSMMKDSSLMRLIVGLKLNVQYNEIHELKTIAGSIANHDVCTQRRANNIFFRFYCGFPLCMFTDEQIGMLWKSPMVEFVFYCASQFVVYPNLKIGYCIKSDHKFLKDYFMIDTFQKVSNYFQKALTFIKNTDTNCTLCEYFQNICNPCKF